MVTPPKKNSKKNVDQWLSQLTSWSFWSKIFLVGSSGLLLLFCYSHAMRPHWIIYATIVPVFAWVISGVCLAVLGFRFRLASKVLLLGWVLAGLVLGDSPWNALRVVLPVSQAWTDARTSGIKTDNGWAVRVITLNCRREINAVADVAALRPDVLLLQESISEKDIQELLLTHFIGYEYLSRGDASVLVRGEIKSLKPAKSPKSYTLHVTNLLPFN